jgi:hypothetical protein
MGNRLAVRVSCDYTPIFFVSASLLVDDGQSGSPRAFRIGSEKRPWDMPTSQSNSVLETWTLADLSLPIWSADETDYFRVGDYSSSAGINRHVVGDERALQERNERFHPDL